MFKSSHSKKSTEFFSGSKFCVFSLAKGTQSDVQSTVIRRVFCQDLLWLFCEISYIEAKNVFVYRE